MIAGMFAAYAADWPPFEQPAGPATVAAASAGACWPEDCWSWDWADATPLTAVPAAGAGMPESDEHV